jgi:hypothetical protein
MIYRKMDKNCANLFEFLLILQPFSMVSEALFTKTNKNLTVMQGLRLFVSSPVLINQNQETPFVSAPRA